MTRWTALARPLDPAWPTNRAVMALMLVGALATGTRAALFPWPDAPHPVLFAVLGSLVVLGSWALARELAPDDQHGAFLALGLGIGAYLLRPEASLLLLFTTLGLARMLTRTVGPPTKVTDGVALLVLVGWSMAWTRSIGTALVGALAFALDAGLPGGLRRQWGFAVLCLVLASVLGQTGAPGRPWGTEPSATFLGLLFAVGLLFGSAILRTHRIEATTDLTEAPVAPSRVRAAMLVSLLMPLQLVRPADAGAGRAALLWAVLAGVGLASLRWRAPARALTWSSRR